MTTVDRYAPGTFCWAELATSDTEAAKRFYGGLFGWAMDDVPAGPDVNYTMLRLDGRDVGGMYALGPQQREQGVPPHWASYVAVESADETAARAARLGGTVLAPPFDVMEIGRMAFIRDPQGAVFAIWEARKHHGAGVRDVPGAVCWNELMATDAEGARRFYGELFAWKIEDAPMPSGTYTLFRDGDAYRGGMMQMDASFEGIPPHWMVYFAVADCDAGAARARELGGEVKVPPTDIPGIGRFAVIQDPQGAIFSILAFAAQS